MFVENVGIYDTMQPLNVFGSLSDWDTSTSLTGGRSPDPAPSSCTPAFPSFFGAFYSTVFQPRSSTSEANIDRNLVLLGKTTTICSFTVKGSLESLHNHHF